ncbi:MAG TPA: KH domain-containing protein [Candidatus Enterosoma merdigallinarum]|nr:KH domain-containing protein [Candidatus Enterosoma merdigallinarum]
MNTGTDIDLTQDIRSLVEPLVSNPEKVIIQRMDKPEYRTRREQNYLILCEKDDLGKLIGRHGVISDSLRTILNVSIKNMRKKVHLRFESYSDYKASHPDFVPEQE